MLHLTSKEAEVLGINEEGDFEGIWVVSKNKIMFLKYHQLNHPPIEISIFEEDNIEDTVFSLKEFLLTHDYKIVSGK